MYRGSNERRSFLLPIPYFVYRGETVQVNRERVRGLIFKRDRAEMDISVNGSVPAQGSVARQGMPDLDPTLEIGPSLNFHLLYSADKKNTFDLRMPAARGDRLQFQACATHRLAVPAATGSGFSGYRPQRLEHRAGRRRDLFRSSLPRSIFTTWRRSMRRRRVRPIRWAADIPARSTSLSFSKRAQDGHWIGGFMKWDNLNGAVFANSPLVKSRQYFTIGIAATWTFNRSDKMVEVNDD